MAEVAPKKYLSAIETPKEAYIIDYPQAVDFAQKQAMLIWHAEELGVEKDTDDVRLRFTEGERHGLMTAQRIFQRYEMTIGGDEAWGGHIARLFPRPEIQRMCATFSFFELGVHAPFYDAINKALDVATEEFYLAWKTIPEMATRIRYIEKALGSDDPLIATSSLAFWEGVSLFSLFAFFKSFSRGGFSLIPRFCAGIVSSVADEDLHSRASSWLFKTCRDERINNNTLLKADYMELEKNIYQMAVDILDQETEIINLIFSEGDIRPITKSELIDFVKYRVNTVLGYLGLKPLHNGLDTSVADWFFHSVNTIRVADFFSATQTSYTKKWAIHKLGFVNGTN